MRPQVRLHDHCSSVQFWGEQGKLHIYGRYDIEKLLLLDDFVLQAVSAL